MNWTIFEMSVTLYAWCICAFHNILERDITQYTGASSRIFATANDKLLSGRHTIPLWSVVDNVKTFGNGNNTRWPVRVVRSDVKCVTVYDELTHSNFGCPVSNCDLSSGMSGPSLMSCISSALRYADFSRCLVTIPRWPSTLCVKVFNFNRKFRKGVRVVVINFWRLLAETRVNNLWGPKIRMFKAI